MEQIRNYHIITYGCQMNEHDTEVLSGILEQLGYQWTDEPEQADVVLINTCCVRERAENKVIGLLGELKHVKEKNPDVVIGVCGCMAQQPGMAEKLREKVPHVDLVFGTHNVHRLPELLSMAQAADGTIIEIWDKEQEIVESLPLRRWNNIKGYVTIMYGCNNFCTYCIVPYVRGRERSREPQAIQEEVRAMARQGFKEVMLLGQNVNSYGKDLGLGFDFADLLQSLDDIEGLARIRYTTSHPRDFTDKLIETIKNAKKVCEHFHLPVQAGSNQVLKRMNRGYTREYYLDLVKKIRQAIPEATITTDIIVGFPGETDADFEDTLDLVAQVRFDNAFTFLYSPRTGTPAAKWEQVDEEVKKERFQRLLELQNRISWERNQELLGSVQEVLVEGVSKTNAERLTGRTRGNKIVVFEGSEELIGQLVQVRICEAPTWFLVGEVI
ncbi:MAG TPA: tRNA (N6-isopentenyl adenosine(37)-C2)-methylthiotransferase MiaB [Clostridia bacterium]|nr:tRNA (N6-isopentenyl adenosine(37)-C2)-methylthiotransferase MiaB [Clostridia bacterium]